MSQISPPIRILLVGSIVFLAAWFAFLRPGGEVAVDTPTPTPVQPAGASTQPTTPLGEAVQNAQGAAGAAESAAAARAGEAAAPSAVDASTTAASAPEPATAPAGKADVAAKGLPASVAKAVAQKKVLVMLFWNPRAFDDRAVRRELRGVKTHKGQVKVHVASIRSVDRYAPITRGVDLNQSPTVVVVDRNRQAEALVGYVDRVTIDQAVSDARRAR